MRLLTGLCAATVLLVTPVSAADPVFHRPDGRALSADDIDRSVNEAMQGAHVPGLALALIENGRVVYVKAYGLRDREKTLPLNPDTVMYGASLTKAAFAYLVMQLVDEGVIDLDRPIAEVLKKPLPEYEKYADLASDARWRKITPRMLLDHTSGFQNFRFINPDNKLDIKFEPGSRYAYSGEGINLLQFVIEEKTGQSVGALMQTRVFDRFRMAHTSMTWREDFAADLTTGYDADGKAEGHHKRGSVRAAGSMDTTIGDYAAFVAGFVRGEGLSRRTKAEMLKAQMPIWSARQFPTLMTETDPRNARARLASGLGWVLFRGPYGPGFFKGGHDEWTDNFALCVERQKRCVVVLTNSGVASKAFPGLFRALLGETGAPLYWEGQEP